MTERERRLGLETALTYLQHACRRIEVSSEGLPKAPSTDAYEIWMEVDGARRRLVQHLNTEWDDA